MMVPLLEDIFHLKVHREKRQMPVYKLSVASGGLEAEARRLRFMGGANSPAHLRAWRNICAALRKAYRVSHRAGNRGGSCRR